MKGNLPFFVRFLCFDTAADFPIQGTWSSWVQALEVAGYGSCMRNRPNNKFGFIDPAALEMSFGSHDSSWSPAGNLFSC